MNISADCIGCIINGQLKHILPLGNETTRTEYMRNVLRIIADGSENFASPWITYQLEQEFERFWGFPMHTYDHLKTQYNTFMLEKEYMTEEIMAQSSTPLETAIKLARAGNYIDFSAMIDVSEEGLLEILHKSVDEVLPAQTVAQFKQDLEKAKTLVYLTDNCGEIVLDKVLIKTIRKLYPQIDITVITRGGDALNDATVEDALAVGMDKIARVIGNGLAVPGTELKKISAESLSCINNADVIISKGMGNFETVSSCGLNVYYIFLCKCSYFERRFKLPRLTGVFIRELDHTPEYWNTF
ncbi:MAG: DUF89 family protein [Oscillospiraceae bacterium]|nr:DUF89 family protein [Oscillospiraceae bacterium]MBQ8670136.1 DUF89 family protein [Oscillospiraceae bacterium]